MRFLSTLIAFGLFLSTSATAQPTKIPVDLELVLAVDVSGSVDEEEAALQRQGYVDALRHPDVIRAITSGFLRRVGVTYFEWAGDHPEKPVIGWRLIEDAKSADQFADELASKPVGVGPWTSISNAITFSMAMFEASPFEGTRRIIDISGDGPNNVGPPVTLLRDQTVAKRIAINGLPIMNNRPNFGRIPMPNLDLYYRNCVIGGPGGFIVVANGFKDFARAIRRKLVLEIADLQPIGSDVIITHGQAQRGGKKQEQRWVPPCNEGERRFRGWGDDEW